MVADALRASINQFIGGFITALPSIISGIVFLLTAYVGIKLSLYLVRSSLRKIYTDEIIVDLGSTVVSIFLWFGTVLVFLNILGFEEIAASLGTATGFIALGVAFAVSDMIADTVAGFYLLRDPDFEEGDTVKVGEIAGTVSSVGLRKSRIKHEDGLEVISNSEVEKRWTKSG